MARRKKKGVIDQLLDAGIDYAAAKMISNQNQRKKSSQNNSPGCLTVMLYTLFVFPVAIAIFLAMLGTIFLLIKSSTVAAVVISAIAGLSILIKSKIDKRKRETEEKNSEIFETENEIVKPSIEIPQNPPQSSPFYIKKPADYLNQLKTEQFCRRECDAHYKIVVIDFETTGLEPSADEILQVSIIDEAGNTLINQYCKPTHTSRWAEAWNVNHIYPSQVEYCPPFADIAPYVQDILSRADTVIAYSYPFEADFLRANGIDPDALTWGTDPMKLACKCYNKQHHSTRSRIKLTAAAEMIGYTYNAHDALEDVKATLRVYQDLQNPDNITVKKLEKKAPTKAGGVKYKSNPNADPNHPLYGKTIVITGELPIDREEASLKAADLGAKVRIRVSPRTEILVCGERADEWAEQYGEKSYKIKSAEKFNEEGADIEFMSGDEFIALLNQPAGQPGKVSTVDT